MMKSTKQTVEVDGFTLALDYSCGVVHGFVQKGKFGGCLREVADGRVIDCYDETLNVPQHVIDLFLQQEAVYEEFCLDQ